MTKNNATSPDDFFRLLAQNNERLKELAAINRATAIIKEGQPIESTLRRICLIMPDAWQFPTYTVSRIRFGSLEYTSPGFTETPWRQKLDFEVIDGERGSLEVFYTWEFPDEHEGPFLKEERDLLNNLSSLIVGYINSFKGKGFVKQVVVQKHPHIEEEVYARKQFLQRFINQNNTDRDIYHDLMPFRVTEVLLVATLYNAYIFEREDRVTETILGDYSRLSLSYAPRITGVSTLEEAQEKLALKHFNMVIIMMGTDRVTPLEISRSIKKEYPYIPLYMLINNSTMLGEIEQNPMAISSIDKLFDWNGDPRVFFSMIKLLEDKVNLENDTKVGLTRVILLVEDSPNYYSRYLPALYTSVLEQTRRVVDDVSSEDDLYKLLRIRIRPKIILAGTYQEAMEVVSRYRDYMLCLITDAKFFKDGKLNEGAGFELVEEVRRLLPSLPIIMQSFDQSSSLRVQELNRTLQGKTHRDHYQQDAPPIAFVSKNSDSLMQELMTFINSNLGFGDFNFTDSKGRVIATARSMEDFERCLREVPGESLFYHAEKNHFSQWLTARGEINVARIIHPSKIEDFSTTAEIREFFLSTLTKHRREKLRGKVIPFDPLWDADDSNIVALSRGSLGGKGRGLAFINTLLYSFEISQYVPGINLHTPRTAIIGTNEYDWFMQHNSLYPKVMGEKDYRNVKQAFLSSELSSELVHKLERMLEVYRKPLAIRSSGLLEDSLMQPFAGVFETYILPNNHPNPKDRLNQLTDAIKLVYASVFSDTSRDYIRAINFRIEDEKMAVIVQEVVGNQHGNYFYPHISGVAQSYNYYPYGHNRPEDGLAVAALGLGRYVVEGHRSYRFCPRYPTLTNYSTEDLVKYTQTEFYAIDLERKDLKLLDEGETAALTRLTLYDAEQHGTLKHCVSVYDKENNTITPGLTHQGSRVVNFSNILKYNYIPLPLALQVVLEVVEEALGSACEVEFAVDLKRDANYKATFYLLQIKPLVSNASSYNINLGNLNPKDTILLSKRAMGNGSAEDIRDVIYIRRDRFNRSMTREMAQEAEALNRKMVERKCRYILIGPGRWGTRDRWIGIPVTWSQISNAKVIVETSFDDFPLDASSGSHFFHNVVSMNVGYCSVNKDDKESNIAWNRLDCLEAIEETTFFRHVRFPIPLEVKMDGRQRVILVREGAEVSG